jgi:hypothetical protein
MNRWTLEDTMLTIAFAMILAAVMIGYWTDTPPIHRPKPVPVEAHALSMNPFRGTE